MNRLEMLRTCGVRNWYYPWIGFELCEMRLSSSCKLLLGLLQRKPGVGIYIGTVSDKCHVFSALRLRRGEGELT